MYNAEQLTDLITYIINHKDDCIPAHDGSVGRTSDPDDCIRIYEAWRKTKLTVHDEDLFDSSLSIINLIKCSPYTHDEISKIVGAFSQPTKG